MCEFSTKIVAWLDQELPADEAVALEQHVAACSECRELTDRCQEASRAFALCVEGVPVLETGHARNRKVLLAASAVVAASVALFLIVPRHPVDPALRIQVSAPAAPAIVLPARPSPSLAAVSKPRSVKRTAAPVQTWMPVEPTISIAIPSDALFPPGAVPEGFAFVGDLSLAADGTPALIAFRP